MAAPKTQPLEQYIRVEISDKKHLIASRMIGHETAFNQIAVVTNRNQAERLLAKLNS